MGICVAGAGAAAATATNGKTLDKTFKILGDHFITHFPQRRSGNRQIGREAEYPVVWADGTAAGT